MLTIHILGRVDVGPGPGFEYTPVSMTNNMLCLLFLHRIFGGDVFETQVASTRLPPKLATQRFLSFKQP